MLFDIGAGELLLIVVMAVLMFGPEKMSEFARKAARVVHYLRGVANQATSTLKEELGPEFADLKASDLTPRKLLAKYVLDDIQDDIDEIKNDLNEVKSELEMGASGAVLAAADVKASLQIENDPERVVVGIPFDAEST